MARILVLSSLGLPIFISFLLYFAGRKKEYVRDVLGVGISGLTFTLIIALYPFALRGGMSFRLTGFVGSGITFRVDMVSFILSLVTAFVWLLISLYSVEYISHSHEKNRYWMFLIMTLGATLGVFLSGDLLSLFIFFEMMTFTSYVLVIHDETPDVLKAGNYYLYMAVGGGLVLLMGVFILFYELGSLDFPTLAGGINSLGSMKYVVAALLIAGFGVKAGMVPLHIWLPRAHPVAPSPASALLSGILIKAGAFGILKVTNQIFGWDVYLGSAIIFTGFLTMFSGAFMALFQDNTKRILAYSSMSQMGYILVGIGAAAYLGGHGGLAFIGTIYHILNHAVFKVTLFLAIGTIYYRTHELSLKRLGGFGKFMPLTTFAFVVALLGITGVPGFNGFASKTLLHESIQEVYHLSGNKLFLLGEKIFTITGSLTLSYMVKLFAGVFLGKPASGLELRASGSRYSLILGVLFILSGVVVLIGLMPNLVVDNMMIYALLESSFYGREEIVEHAAGFAFFDSGNILSSLLVLAIGALIYIAFKKFGLFDKKPPGWLSVEYLVYIPVGRMMFHAVSSGFAFIDSFVDSTYKKSSEFIVCLSRGFAAGDSAVDSTYMGFAKFFAAIFKKFHIVDDTFEAGYIGGGAKQVLEKISGGFEDYTDDKYETAGKALSGFLRERSLKMTNLNVSVFIFAFVLVAMMLIFIQYASQIRVL
jgi:formate hydrogenlyase subunit 3/multisubunit Na+/H+ antiporter MnhD subunit